MTAAYGNSTSILKDRWAALVGRAHAASVRFVLPITVYTRTSPLVLRLGVHLTSATSFVSEITERRKSLKCTKSPLTELRQWRIIQA